MLEENNKFPFANLAYSWYFFTKILYEESVNSNLEDLLFISREGFALKKLFDFYQLIKNPNVKIRTHYLKVSRRSTFMISLKPLKDEDFEILFRQYRKISINSFLKSLNLDDFTEDLAKELKVTKKEFKKISLDLPSDPIFLRLINLKSFRKLYEKRRDEQSTLFQKYLKLLLGTTDIPKRINLVDVGWKGTIQDNIFNWTKQITTERITVHGYYLGLLKGGAIDKNNCKKGLLFSNVDRVSRGLNIYLDNLSLFELFLHANHASVKSYKQGENVFQMIEYDDYSEKDLIENKILPISDKIFTYFKTITIFLENSNKSVQFLEYFVIKKHFSMIFYPSEIEIESYENLQHKENFGCFIESNLDSRKNNNLWGKLKLSFLVISNLVSESYFWRYLYIRRNCIYGVSTFYRLYRYLQYKLNIN